jgi:hypothetical protein
MNLPKNESNFQLEHEGETTGHKYEGRFTIKCVLSLSDKRTVELEQTRLNMDTQNPTVDLSAISRVVANLRVRVKDSPDWFKQAISTLDIIDEDVIFEVYGKCLEKEREWRDSIKKKPEANEGNSQTES